MLASSSEYLKALREGKYLLFLEWTEFITQKYTNEKDILDADDTANSLIFEWLNNGYSEEDAKKIVLLHAVYDLECRPLQGKLDYSLNAITIALFLCMIFHKHNLHLQSDSPKVTCHEINQLIKKSSMQLDPLIYNGSLDGVRSQFFQWVESTDKNEVNIVFQKIYAITRPRYLLEDYILHLERAKKDQDELYTARLSMAKRFLRYLYEQTELTSVVTNEMAIYINAIRELHPSKWEEARLDAICPPSTLDNTWRWVTGMGISFFNFVFHEKSIGELISGVSQKQKL